MERKVTVEITQYEAEMLVIAASYVIADKDKLTESFADEDDRAAAKAGYDKLIKATWPPMEGDDFHLMDLIGNWGSSLES